MKKVEVLAIVKEEIRTASRVFELHCKDEAVTRKQLETYRNYAIGKLTATINIWISLEMGYLTEAGMSKENLEKAKEIRGCEKEIEENIRAMYEKKLEEID